MPESAHGQVSEIPVNSRDEWSRLLDGFQDASLYQTWDYAEIHWAYARKERKAFLKHGVAVCLAQVIILDLPLVRIAYVPWGPVWRRRDRPDDVNALGKAASLLREDFVQRRKMALRFRPYGFEDHDRTLNDVLLRAGFAPSKADAGGVSRTILVDLDCPEDDLRRRLSKKWRNSLSFSEKEPLTIRESQDENDLLLLRSPYDALKRKRKFDGTDLDELATIQSRLPPAQKLRITLAEYQGRVIAGSVCSGLGETVLGLLGITSEEGRKTRAYYLLQWDEILWARRNSHAAYDLNGINPEKNPKVYHFKAGLKGREVRFLGVYDCYPGQLSRCLVKFSDRVVGRLKKGKVRRALKRLRAREGKTERHRGPGPHSGENKRAER